MNGVCPLLPISAKTELRIASRTYVCLKWSSTADSGSRMSRQASDVAGVRHVVELFVAWYRQPTFCREVLPARWIGQPVGIHYCTAFNALGAIDSMRWYLPWKYRSTAPVVP